MRMPMVAPESGSTLNRRTFLSVTAGAVGGLLVSAYFDFPVAAQTAQQSPGVKYPPSAFVHIKPDGKIVIQVNRLEFGQGANTGLPMLTAEEMDADWSQVISELAPAGDVYRDPKRGMQITGGSGSIACSYDQYRELGARTRAMLVNAAAARWNVDPSQCRTEASVVYGPGGQSAKYAELADEASRQPIPATVKLKDPSQFRLVGKQVRRLDGRAKCDGTQKFGLDLDLPGMKVAVVAHPPVFGGKVKSVDDKAARAVEGVADVFVVPVFSGGTGVAVVADKFWTAKTARERLKVEWDFSGRELADSTQLWTQFREMGNKQGLVAVSAGDMKALTSTGENKRIVAEFEFPYLAHAMMEPLNGTVRYDGDGAEAWIGSQMQINDRQAVAEVLGLAPEKVVFHTEMAGGGFGRRVTGDSHLPREIAEIAKRFKGTPVKLIWTREDDIQGGYYRPMHLHRAEIATGDDGMPVAWRHVIVGQSLLAGTPFEQYMKDGIDGATTEGVANTHYAIPNFHVSVHHPKLNVPVLWWRSVGNTHTAFVMETLIDELAARAKADPIAYRRNLLKPQAKKLINALNLMDEKSAAWRSKLPEGHAVGVACHESFETGVACAVDVSIENGRPRVHRVTVAADAGVAVSPMSIENQFQGGIVFGISQLIPGGAITLKEGKVEQSNFGDFAVPYIADSPTEIDVHMVPSNEPPTGCGEPPVTVIAPAVVNAIAQLTGKRYRTLPLGNLGSETA